MHCCQCGIISGHSQHHLATQPKSSVSVYLPHVHWKVSLLKSCNYWRSCFLITTIPSRACLTVRFTVKNGDPPGAGKIQKNWIFTGKIDYQGHKNAKIDETICQRGHSTCRNFFPITIVALGVTFLKAILRFAQNGPNCNFRISVLVFVRGVICI